MKKPIIKSAKLRNCLKYWADYNDISEVIVNLGDFDHCGVFIPNGIVRFKDNHMGGVEMFVWRNDEVNLKDNCIYNIDELLRS